MESNKVFAIHSPVAPVPPTHVIVKFGDEVPAFAQGVALLQMEKTLRHLTQLDCRVFKDKMADDSKLRRSMTEEERAKL